MSLLDSPILGRLTDFEEDVETQDEINEESLFEYDQRSLLDSIRDLTISKYDVEFLLERVDSSYGEFWGVCLKEIIHVFSLDTLKNFLFDEFIPEKIEETKLLIRFLKCVLPYALRDESLPVDREGILEFFNKLQQPGYMKYAIDTIDRDSLERFKRVILEIRV